VDHVKALVSLAVVAGCSGGSPTPPERPVARPDAGAARPAATPDAAADDVPWACGASDREACMGRALKLVESRDPNEQAEGVTILRAFCEQGDERRCFEADVSVETHDRCVSDRLVESCLRLAELYQLGIATCPYDTACANALNLMVCTGGTESACKTRVEADAGP
jgi:hypothetical protein